MEFRMLLERRKPQTLQDLCFLVIAENFNKVISRPSSEAGMRVLETNSQLLFEQIKEISVGEYRSISLFCVNQYLKKLMLNMFHKDDLLLAVHKLKTVESTLVALHVPAVSLDILWEVVRVLPETLQRLCLRSTVCTDDMLKGIAQRCPNLRKLDLRNCSNITNAGIQALCLDDEQGNICPNLVLEKLYLYNTKVTKEGVLFALKNFTNLTKLLSIYLKDVLSDIYETVLRESSLNVSTLNLKSLYMIKDSLKICSVLCPFITVLHHSHEDFHTLMQFRLLERVLFSVEGFFDYFTFFEARGNILKHVTLFIHSEEFALPAELIIKFCPRLEYLHLICSFAEVKTKPILDAQYILRHLRVLRIYSKSNNFLKESLMLLLSRSPNLKKFFFKNAEYFEYVPFLSSLVQNISMSTLEILELIGVDTLMSRSALLQVIPEFEFAKPKAVF